MAQQDKISLIEFQRKYNTEKKCEKHIIKHKWPDGYICEKCQHTEFYYIATRKHYQCKFCGYQESITANTVMHKTHVPLVKWFWAIYLIVTDKRGISALAFMKQSGVAYNTAWKMFHKIREIMENRDEKYQLSRIVEVDEAYFGGPDNSLKRGRGTSKSKVIVAVSTNDAGDPQYAKMTIVDDLKSETMLEVIDEQIELGAAIVTDGYSIYSFLKDSEYTHVALQPDDEPVTWVHKLISNAKAFINGTFHGLGTKHLQKYLSEFCYRFNRRFWEPQLFNRLIDICSMGNPLKFPELVK